MDYVEGEHFNLENSEISDVAALMLAGAHFATLLERLASEMILDEYIQTKITDTIT